MSDKVKIVAIIAGTLTMAMLIIEVVTIRKTVTQTSAAIAKLKCN